jgi:geranylgeranyl pyrophosphate synthase
MQILLAVVLLLILIIAALSAKLYTVNCAITKMEDAFGLNINNRAAQRKDNAQLRVISSEDLLRPKTLGEYQSEINGLIERAYTLEDFGHKTLLSEACKKALTGGKRVRSAILMEIARATTLKRGGVAVDPAEVALFIEYLHSASLVIDDLPEFDNDLTRRGLPSLHAEMGPAVAQMAAISLVAAAFQNICRQIDWIRDNCPDFKYVDRVGVLMCNDVSRAIGAAGAAGGQYMDISSIDDLIREHGTEALFELMYKKTATFFEMAVVIGWLVAGGDVNETDALRAIGRHVGIAFQIADDIGDMTSDAERKRWNFANEYSREFATAEVTRNLQFAQDEMAKRGLWTPIWENELFPAIWGMTGNI